MLFLHNTYKVASQLYLKSSIVIDFSQGNLGIFYSNKNPDFLWDFFN